MSFQNYSDIHYQTTASGIWPIETASAGEQESTVNQNVCAADFICNSCFPATVLVKMLICHILAGAASLSITALEDTTHYIEQFSNILFIAKDR